MTIDINIFPYYDDYDETKKFAQILFRPGRAVQARELSQIQSAIQKQIERFGRHVFTEGSMVIPGATAVNVSYPFLKLQPLYNLVAITLSDFANKKIIGLTSGTIATVLTTLAAEGSDPNTLYVKFESGESSQSFTGTIFNTSNVITNISILSSQFVVGALITGSGIPANTFITKILSTSSVQISNPASADNPTASLTVTTADTFLDGETIQTVEDSPVSALLAASASTGLGSTAQIQKGVYFTTGFFCLVEDQLLILDKYTNTPSYKVGLLINTSLVSADNDITLNDPAAGFTNFNAPGADRLKIELAFSKLDLNTNAGTNFIELIRIKDGVVQTQVTRPSYSELEKTLARRTFDQSGDYTVRYFPVEIKEHLDNGSNGGLFTLSNGGLEDHIAIAVEPGKAYVKGFEIESQETIYLPSPKTRDTKVFSNYATAVDFGNYIDCADLEYVFNISQYEQVTLYDAIDGGGSSIGTALVRGITFISGTPGDEAAIYRVNLFNIVMGGGFFFKDARSFKDSVTNAAINIITVGGNAVLNNVDASIGLVPIPTTSVKTLKPGGIGITNYLVRRYFAVPMSTTTATLTAGVNEIFESFSNEKYIIAIDTASVTATGNGYVNGDIINITGPHTATLAGSPLGKQIVFTLPDISGSTLKIIATIHKTLTTQKSKTLTTRTQATVSFASVINLDKADISSIISIIDDSTSANITDHFTLDNGQRDNLYNIGKLTFNPIFPTPATTVTINYKYFAHGLGDYFSVDSYTSAGVAYGDIPLYTSNTSGQTFDLINCLDFRPRINDAGTDFSVYSEFVDPGTDITLDFEYYLARIDKLFLDQDGNFKIIQGKSSTSPVAPAVPDNGMTLYDIVVPPYTFNTKSVITTLIDNRRYTMRDIGHIQQRVANLEYYTALSLLEKTTSDLFIDDGSGHNRFKNGFIVDNFQSHLVGDVALFEYQCSMDTQNGLLRPQFFSQNVELPVDVSHSPSTWVKTLGGLITLPFTEISFISQLFATRTENINPYNIYNWIGKLELAPSSDDWYDTTILPDIVTQSVDNTANNFASLNGQVIWNDWQNTWTGAVISSTPVQGATTVAADATFLRANNATAQVWIANRSFGELTAEANQQTGRTGLIITSIDFTSATGTAIARNTVTREVGQTRTGLAYSVVSSTTNQVIDTKLVNTGVVPFIRSKTINFTATVCRPNTRVYPFFDNINVAAYVTPSVLITDAHGSVSGTFTIPDPKTSGVQFRTGQRLFKLIDNADGNTAVATTSASSTYTASGILQTSQNSILSTRTSQLVQNTVSQSRTSVGTNTETQTETIQLKFWSDPLAQTFLINVDGGVFISKINVYMSSKDSSIPLTMQLRTVVNGYPGPQILPFGEVSLNPADINISEDGSIPTTFHFPSPVYLQNNQEYCFVLMANSGNYNAWVCELGGLDTLTNSYISKQPYAGVMFKSQNASTWTAAQEEDIKFEIFRCSFDTVTPGDVLFRNADIPPENLFIDPLSTTNGSKIVSVFQPNHDLTSGQKTTIVGVVGPKNNIPASELNGQHTVTVTDFDNYTITVSFTNANKTGSTGGSGISATKNYQTDLINLNIQSLSFTKTELDFAIKTTDIAGNIDPLFSNVSAANNLYLNTQKAILSVDNENVGQSLLLNATMTTTVENLSPVIDTQRCAAIIVGNRINDDATGELNAKSGKAIARYITKQVTLVTEANSINVNFAATRPAGSDVKVYVKTLPTDSEATFDVEDYVEVPAVDYPAADGSNPKDYSFALDSLPLFTIFAVKVVMLSTSTSNVPQIKDFRAIATVL